MDCQSLPLPALHVSSLADSTTAYAAPPVTLSSLADLQSLVESYFSPELAASLFSLSPDHYRDFDGVLYAQSADRGSNLYLLDKTVSAAQTDADPLDRDPSPSGPNMRIPSRSLSPAPRRPGPPPQLPWAILSLRWIWSARQTAALYQLLPQ